LINQGFTLQGAILPFEEYESENDLSRAQLIPP